METDETTYIPVQTEAARVDGWRLKCLIEAGYPVRLAERVAASQADLHQAVELLEHGCTPETAAAILI